MLPQYAGGSTTCILLSRCIEMHAHCHSIAHLDREQLPANQLLMNQAPALQTAPCLCKQKQCYLQPYMVQHKGVTIDLHKICAIHSLSGGTYLVQTKYAVAVCHNKASSQQLPSKIKQ